MSDFTQPSSPTSNQVELEFVQQVLADASEGYCWDPAEDSTNADPGQVDSKSTEFLQVELNGSPFFETLERSWNEADAALKLETQLRQTLGDRLPQGLLARLLISAQQVIYTGQSLSEQLVQCIEGLIPQLDEDDLQVMARPYAVAMRDRGTPQSLEGLQTSVRATQWTELSPIEQARLSLAISHYILSELPRHAPKAP
ncbi:MAG: hypothetical protein ACFB4J_13075 [Elainellaceae cyanobacterium]